jgi:hypothetical protein
LTPLDDQQLAGLLMWVPIGSAYFAACLLLAGRPVVADEHRTNLAKPVAVGPREGSRS